MTAIRMSVTPRFFSTFITRSQNFAVGEPAFSRNHRTPELPLQVGAGAILYDTPANAGQLRESSH